MTDLTLRRTVGSALVLLFELKDFLFTSKPITHG